MIDIHHRTSVVFLTGLLLAAPGRDAIAQDEHVLDIASTLEAALRADKQDKAASSSTTDIAALGSAVSVVRTNNDVTADLLKTLESALGPRGYDTSVIAPVVRKADIVERGLMPVVGVANTIVGYQQDGVAGAAMAAGQFALEESWSAVFSSAATTVGGPAAGAVAKGSVAAGFALRDNVAVLRAANDWLTEGIVSAVNPGLTDADIAILAHEAAPPAFVGSPVDRLTADLEAWERRQQEIARAREAERQQRLAAENAQRVETYRQSVARRAADAERRRARDERRRDMERSAPTYGMPMYDMSSLSYAYQSLQGAMASSYSTYNPYPTYSYPSLQYASPYSGLMSAPSGYVGSYSTGASLPSADYCDYTSVQMNGFDLSGYSAALDQREAECKRSDPYNSTVSPTWQSTGTLGTTPADFDFMPSIELDTYTLPRNPTK